MVLAVVEVVGDGLEVVVVRAARAAVVGVDDGLVVERLVVLLLNVVPHARSLGEHDGGRRTEKQEDIVHVYSES